MVEVVATPAEEVTTPQHRESNGALRWSSARKLAKRAVRAAINGLSLYIMITLACVVAAVIMNSYLGFVSSNGTLILANALTGPVLFAVLVTNAFLCLTAAAGLAGEREQGTLQVLFYGPVDSTSYISGKLLGCLIVYAIAMIALLIFLVIAAAISGMGLDGGTVLLLVSSLLPAAATIALGMLVAALVGKQRPAIALTAVVLLLFVAIEVANRYAAAQPANSTLGGAAGLIAQVAALVGWISPFGYILRAAEAFTLQNTREVLLQVLAAALYAALLTWLAIVTLTRRGVERWRE